MKIDRDKLNELAAVYLEDRACNALLTAGRALRTSELAEAVSQGASVSALYLREAFTYSKRVVHAERKWDLASRHLGAEHPVEGLVRETIRCVGHPAGVAALAHEVSISCGLPASYYHSMLAGLLPDRPQVYVPVGGDEYGLNEWLIDVTAQDDEDVRLENYIVDEEPDIDAVVEALDIPALRRRTTDASICAAVLETIGRPLTHRVLGYILWLARDDDFDAEQLLADLYNDARFHLLSNGHWCDEEQWTAIQSAVVKMARDVSRGGTGDVRVDVTKILSAAADKPITLDDGDVDEIFRATSESRRPLSVIEAVMDVFEMYPDDGDFVATVQALQSKLASDSRFVPVGTGLWTFSERIPEHVRQVPTLLEPVHLSMTDPIEDEEIDAILEDAGLDADTVKIVRAPEFEDFGEEDEVIKVAKSRMSKNALTVDVPYHHYKSGTMKARLMDEDLYAQAAPIQLLLVADAGGVEHELWLNREFNLVHGLGELYEKHGTPSGTTVTLTEESPGVYEVAVTANDESPLYVDPSRVQDIEKMAETAQERSLRDIMVDLLVYHTKGASLMQLWAEVNIIRRTTKRLVASNLHSYPCFYTRGKGDKVTWAYDERKVEQGRSREKRKHIRK